MTSTRHIRQRIEGMMADLPAEMQDRFREGVQDLIGEAQLHGREEARIATKTDRRVWCTTCLTEHIGNVPAQSWQCDGFPEEEAGCGFGSWRDDIASEHVSLTEGHSIRLVTHRVVPLDERDDATALDTPEAREWAVRMLAAELARLNFVGHQPMHAALASGDWEWFRNHPIYQSTRDGRLNWDEHLPVLLGWLSGKVADGSATVAGPSIGEVLDDLDVRLTRADRELQLLAESRGGFERIRTEGKREGVRLAISYLRGTPRG